MEKEDQRRGGVEMTAGPWKDRAAFDAWWRQNVIAFNRLSVTDPREWERIAKQVEQFQRSLET
jgi:hypothetical protein